MGVTEDKWPSLKTVVEFTGRGEGSNFEVRITCLQRWKEDMVSDIVIVLYVIRWWLHLAFWAFNVQSCSIILTWNKHVHWTLCVNYTWVVFFFFKCLHRKLRITLLMEMIFSFYHCWSLHCPCSPLWWLVPVVLRGLLYFPERGTSRSSVWMREEIYAKCCLKIKVPCSCL